MIFQNYSIVPLITCSTEQNGIVENVVGSMVNSTALNLQTTALLETFNKLTPVEQAQVLVYADELTNK